jgi:predicted component of type VI protein secretion system
MGCKLVVKKGPATGTSYDLDQVEIFVGRDLGNDIVVNDPEISRRHARLYKHGDHYLVEDLGSTNGTIVNGQKIRGPKQLTNHDYVAMGQNIGYEFISDQPLGYEAQTVAVDDMGFDEGATFVAEAPIPELEIQAAQEPALTPDIPEEFAQVPQGNPAQAQEMPAFPAEQPGQPVVPQTNASSVNDPEPVKAKRSIPLWLIIVVILLAIACICIAAIWVIDSQMLWCTILPFLPGCVGS